MAESPEARIVAHMTKYPKSYKSEHTEHLAVTRENLKKILGEKKM